LERLTIYLMETGRLLIQPPVETVALVFDLSGFGLGNMDYTLVKFLVQCFQAYYPESLGSIMVHKSPLVFWGVWKIIEPWLDPVVASKIRFTSTDQELLEFIPAEHLPSTFQGVGLDQYKYEYLAPVAGENDKMQDRISLETQRQAWALLTEQYDAQTKIWIEGGNIQDQKREELVKALRLQYYKLQPYIRARNQFQRKDATGHSVLQEDGTVEWIYKN
jgi:hypothetical protein